MGAWAPKEQRWFCLNALLERARADIQLQQRKQQQQSKENVRPGFAVAVESRSKTADGEQKHIGDEGVKGSKKAPVEVRKQHSLRRVLKHAFKSCRDLHRRPRTALRRASVPCRRRRRRSPRRRHHCACARLKCASAAPSISTCSTTTTRLTAGAGRV